MQGFLTWSASTPRGAEINFRGAKEGHLHGSQRFVHGLSFIFLLFLLMLLP